MTQPPKLMLHLAEQLVSQAANALKIFPGDQGGQFRNHLDLLLSGIYGCYSGLKIDGNCSMEINFGPWSGLLLIGIHNRIMDIKASAVNVVSNLFIFLTSDHLIN